MSIEISVRFFIGVVIHIPYLNSYRPRIRNNDKGGSHADVTILHIPYLYVVIVSVSGNIC